MRILHVTDSFAPKVGGIEHQVETLARHQIDAGHIARIVTAVPDDGTGDHDVSDLTVVRPRLSRILTSGSPPAIRRLARRGVRGLGVDVIHAHLSFASPLAVHTARYASRNGIPLALTVHSMWPERVIWTRGSNLPYWFLPIRGAWSAVSTAATENMRPVIGADTPITVVPNIVETRWWHPTEPLRETNPQHINVVSVGRLARRKRVEPLVEILRTVRERLDPAVQLHVTIVGDGSRRRRVEQLLTDYAMTDWVRLAGQLEPAAIRTLLQNADLFVAPAVRESFGIAALEARSAGLPIVGLRRNGLSDFITDRVEGRLCADDAGIVEALLELGHDPDELMRIRRHTHAHLPVLDAKDALLAVDDLYERARASTRP